MRVKWLDDAIDDLQSLRDYIAAENPTAANNIAKRIVKAVMLLSEQPSIGRQGRVPHTREFIISNTPFILPYRVKNNIIEILRVLHCAMQWPSDF